MDRMKEMLVCISVVVLCSSFIVASDPFTLTCAQSAIVGKYGSSVILPCWLTPEISAETLEIRWYRPEKFKAPLYFYQSGKIITDYQGTYRNRSSLSPRSPQSTGLKQGDVSLKLDNLGLTDIGIFHCYVSGDKSYDDKTVNLSITALGAPPRLSLKHHHDSVNLSCSSCGWFPQPRLLWKSPNEKGAVLSNTHSTVYSDQENGLFCVNSWIILSSSFSNSVSCSVTLSEDEERNVSLDLGARPEDDKSGLWKILFTVALLALLALIGTALFLHRKYANYTLVSRDEQQNVKKIVADLTKDNMPTVNMENLRKDAVTITFDKENCKKDYLTFNSQGDMVRENEKAADKYKEDGFPYELCVRGTNKFQSGRAFWEVELAQSNVPTKQSWLIGVAKASYNPVDNESLFTPLNGFCFLCSDPEKGLYVNTEPEIAFLVKTQPERIGVLLDFCKRKLSFYNVKEHEMVHLFTMIISFQGEFVPLFNPGIGDMAPLKINPQVKPQNKPEESKAAQASNANQHE